MKARIYVNRQIMAANKKESKESGKIVDRPALSINTYKGTIYAKEIQFTTGCKLIQDANNARCSGATIWAEAEFETLIIDGAKANRSLFGTVQEKEVLKESELAID
jgi:hypothetical protein